MIQESPVAPQQIALVDMATAATDPESVLSRSLILWLLSWLLPRP